MNTYFHLANKALGESIEERIGGSYTNFGILLFLRLALCYAAIGRVPTFEDFIAAAISKSYEIMKDVGLTAKPEDCDWNLVVFVPNEQCPIARVAIAPWLVEGICAIEANPTYPFETFDPEAMIGNVRRVVMATLDGTRFLAPVLERVAKMEEADVVFKREHPEALAEIRKSLCIKGMACDDEMRTGWHQEYDHYAARLPS